MAANKDVSLIFMPHDNHYSSVNPYTTRKAIDFFRQNLGGAR